MTDIARARAACEEAAASIAALATDERALEALARLAETVTASLADGGKVWLFGNGGSAADAQHIAAELVGRFRSERRALPAEALTVNTSVLTAIANDFGYDEVFARQVEAHVRPGDVAIGISTSGSSRNVVRGLEAASALGAHTAALTGSGGGNVAARALISVTVPSDDVARIQEAHAVLGHILCELVESSL